MQTQTRNLLLFLTLSAAAVLTGVLARRPPADDAATAPQQAAAKGYFLVETVLDVTDEMGNLQYQILAERVEQRPDTNDFALETMEVRYAPESEIRWGLTAANGLMTGDRTLFDLDDVVLLYTENTDDMPVAFEANALQLDAGESLASSEGPIVFRQGRSETRAVGMSVDLEADSFVLKSDVSVQINR